MDNKKKQLAEYIENEMKMINEELASAEMKSVEKPESLDVKIEELIAETETKQQGKIVGLVGKIVAAALVLFVVSFASGKIAVNRYIANANEIVEITGSILTQKPTNPLSESTKNPNDENASTTPTLPPASTLSPSPTPGIVFPKPDKNKVAAVYQLDEMTQLWLTNESSFISRPGRVLSDTNENGVTATIVWDENTYYVNCRLIIEGDGEAIDVKLSDYDSPEKVFWVGEYAVIATFPGLNGSLIISYNYKTGVMNRRINMGPGIGAWDSEGNLITADVFTSNEFGFNAETVAGSDGKVYYVIPNGYYCFSDIIVSDDYMAFYIRDYDASIYEPSDPQVGPSYLVVIDLKNNNNVVLKEETVYFWGLKFVHGEIK